jgi:hypothetical protein
MPAGSLRRSDSRRTSSPGISSSWPARFRWKALNHLTSEIYTRLPGTGKGKFSTDYGRNILAKPASLASRRNHFFYATSGGLPKQEGSKKNIDLPHG